jgi:hypothetical protein
MRAYDKFLESARFYKSDRGGILGGDPNSGCLGYVIIGIAIVVVFVIMMFL